MYLKQQVWLQAKLVSPMDRQLQQRRLSSSMVPRVPMDRRQPVQVAMDRRPNRPMLASVLPVYRVQSIANHQWHS
jgi:hypothetical protein